MKGILRKTILSILIISVGIFTLLSIKTYGRAHTSVHGSTHSTRVHSSTPKSSTSSSHSVKASKPKSGSKASTSSSTQKSSTSSTTGKTYTTKKSDTGRTTIEHETVKPKEGTTIVNNNPTYYQNFSSQPRYSLSNSIFNYYMLSEIFKYKDIVSYQDIVKALEEKGYTEEEIKQILDEAKTEEEENKPFYDGWKWYNWTLYIILIIFLIGILILVATWC